MEVTMSGPGLVTVRLDARSLSSGYHSLWIEDGKRHTNSVLYWVAPSAGDGLPPRLLSLGPIAVTKASLGQIGGQLTVSLDGSGFSSGMELLVGSSAFAVTRLDDGFGLAAVDLGKTGPGTYNVYLRDNAQGLESVAVKVVVGN